MNKQTRIEGIEKVIKANYIDQSCNPIPMEDEAVTFLATALDEAIGLSYEELTEVAYDNQGNIGDIVDAISTNKEVITITNPELLTEEK